MPIRFIDVSAGYARKGMVIRGISFDLDCRSIILGPNGSGKTTLFRTILGLSVHSSGSILIDGFDVRNVYGAPGLVATNLHEVYELMRVPLKDLARLYLGFGRGDLSRFLGLVEEFDVAGMLNKRLDELSSGQRSLACNFMALAMNAKYTLLDEPFENLDPARRAKMAMIIKENESVIMNTHATWLLNKFSEWVSYLMFDGKVYGPITVSNLVDSSMVEGVSEKAVLTFRVGGKVFSLVEGAEGVKLTGIDSLDRLFEVAL